MSIPLKRLIKKKQRVYNHAKLFQRESDWEEYKNLQSEVRQSLRYAHQQYVTNILNSTDSSVNKKLFWHYTTYISSQKDKTGLGLAL